MSELDEKLAVLEMQLNNTACSLTYNKSLQMMSGAARPPSLILLFLPTATSPTI